MRAISEIPFSMTVDAAAWDWTVMPIGGVVTGLVCGTCFEAAEKLPTPEGQPQRYLFRHTATCASAQASGATAVGAGAKQ